MLVLFVCTFPSHLFTDRWEDDFVECEKIVKGDKGLFVLVGPNMFEFSLFGEDGVKPLCARPTVWNLFVALGDLPQFFQVLVR